MSKHKDREDLVRVAAGTAMGELMRQYWIPAAMSSELERDGAPMRLLLLGERLIAFRDSSGRIGVMDHRCPHRCASLFLGRNEEGGIRCVYHGWKFDAAGNCVDMPNAPPHQDYKRKGQGQGLQGRRAQRSRLGLYGRARRGPAIARDRSLAAARKRIADHLSPSANAIGCRRSKATSTPRISASCMRARSIRRRCPRTI